jgi:hypothetical protein
MSKARIEQFRRPLKSCLNCGKEFAVKNRKRQYCSTKCRPSATRQLTASGMTPTKCGAHSELIACAHLLRSGYDVYRAVNWTSKADLVAVRGSEVIRVQVKTGSFVAEDGTFSYPKPTDDDHDLLIVVSHNGHIVIEEFKAKKQMAS